MTSVTADDATAARDCSAGALLAVNTVISAVTGPADPTNAVIAVVAVVALTAMIAMTCRALTGAAAPAEPRRLASRPDTPTQAVELLFPCLTALLPRGGARSVLKSWRQQRR